MFPVTETAPPLMVQRITQLLGDAMIPVLLLTLGLQLREAGKLNWGKDVLMASMIRIAAGPVIAFALMPVIGISGVAASTGIIQAAMPPAVLSAIIAIEYNIVPAFVASVVCLSTLLSLVSLTLIMTLL